MKKFNTLYGGPPIIRDDSSPNGFTTTDPGEEKLFESILDKYKKMVEMKRELGDQYH